MRQGAVARVRLPLPGIGNASKVKDITAGTGESDARLYPSIGKEVFSRANAVSSPASCPSPSGVHSVHTPTLMRSLHRSNSAREYRSLLRHDSASLTSFEVLPSECPEAITSSQQLVADLSLHPRSQSCEPIVDTSIRTPSARDTLAREIVEEVPLEFSSVQKPLSVRSTSAEVSPRVASMPSQAPSEPRRPSERRVTPPLAPVGSNAGSTSARGRPRSKDSAPRVSVASSVAPRRPLPGQGTREGSGRHRTQSEPPLQKGARGRSLARPRNRLSQLVAEVSSHLSGVEPHKPKKGSTWLQEIAQMELYVEEMQWLIDKYESGDASFAYEALPELEAGPKHPMLFRGDKDIRWVRQQLRMLEQEHGQLLQRLSCVDPSAQEMQAAELRAVEQQILAEQRRQKQLVAESRQREKSLVQHTVDGREVDAKTRAKKDIERLEGELAVWKVKNSSLNKQVQEATQLVQKAQDHHHALGQKAQHMGEALGSEEHAARQAEQRQAQERVQNELASLQQTLEELQDGRERALKNHQRHKREHGRECSLLADTCKELEEQERHLDALERQLQRQVRQQGLQDLLQHNAGE